MVILSTLANGHGGEDGDPRRVFAERIGELDHLTVSFTEAEPPQVRLSLPDLTLQCAVQAAPDGVREHLALRVDAVKPTTGHPEGAKVLTITTRHPVVSADNGTESDTFRLLDWRESTRRASVSPQLYATIKLVDRLEGAEKLRASTQRTRFVSARESWRCRNCRALWRPDDHERCPSCGRVFSEADRRQPEVGKVEFTVAPDDPLNLQADAAVLVEPEDEPNFVGRVSRIDHHRRIVEVVCRTFEHAGTEGYITPSFNRALYQAKRSVLAAIATKDYGVGLLAQLLVAPATISPALPDEPTGDSWLTDGMIPNPPQDRAVGLLANCDAGQCVFIQGPPGTGKTTVIVEAVKRRLARDPDQRILVTSHSNLAVDNALERLAGTPGMRAVRVARAERVHPTVDQFRCDDEDDPRLLTANCYFATCATAATSAITDMNFDIVILDEANKARADEALPALRLGSALAMVGDHKQLPPVEDDALYGIVETDPALEDLVNRSLFEQCWEGGLVDEAKCLLTVQHRMHPDISAYVSKASYESQLQDAPEVQAYSFVTRKPFPVALHFVDTEGMKGSAERRGPGGALRNEAEVRVAAQVVRLLDERCPRELSMAVIAMYAEQVERLRQALGRRKFKRPVKIDTVDSFEGREEDLVVISLVRSNERGRIGFLRVPNRLNVAISRARRLVACIGDSQTLRAGEESMYGVLVEAARSTGGWLPASELVTPTKQRSQAPRRRPSAAPAAVEGEATEGEGARPSRRRRRRGARRPGQPVAVAPGAEDQTAAAAPGAEPGADGAPAQRRRRRRRRGRGTGAPGADGQADGAAAVTATTPGEPAEGGGDTPRARRRRRRRRSGRGGGADGAAPAGTAPAPESSGGGDG
ncbi:MAG TPA: AAA domain-containing protein [Candidatus Dormibacteraeota bacterium]|nr:AAA domain-containing protein [Candidatus Dormibacteraeota bacterium]